jgi:hypothetical protein
MTMKMTHPRASNEQRSSRTVADSTTNNNNIKKNKKNLFRRFLKKNVSERVLSPKNDESLDPYNDFSVCVARSAVPNISKAVIVPFPAAPLTPKKGEFVLMPASEESSSLLLPLQIDEVLVANASTEAAVEHDVAPVSAPSVQSYLKSHQAPAVESIVSVEAASVDTEDASVSGPYGPAAALVRVSSKNRFVFVNSSEEGLVFFTEIKGAFKESMSYAKLKKIAVLQNAQVYIKPLSLSGIDVQIEIVDFSCNRPPKDWQGAYNSWDWQAIIFFQLRKRDYVSFGAYCASLAAEKARQFPCFLDEEPRDANDNDQKKQQLHSRD